MSNTGDGCYDVIIIGGGPAGLSAALLLGRCRRRVLLCDAGHPRNEASKAMHGFLGLDGINPAMFLEQARQDLREYPCVRVSHTTVDHVERGDRAFMAVTREGEAFESRSMILATGVRDGLPDIPGFLDFYGTSVHTCPYCDAWEHQDHRIGVVGNDTATVDLALELLIWSHNITLYTNDPNGLDPGNSSKLKVNGVKIVPGTITRLAGQDGRLSEVVIGTETFLCDGLFFSPVQRHQSKLAHDLGCEVELENGAVICQASGDSSVKGLFIAGNLSKGIQLALVAAAEGIKAAVSANEWLLAADLKAGT